MAAQAQIQGVASSPDKATMERAQREADGPRRRILEAAKLKTVVRGDTPAPANAPAAPAATVSSTTAPAPAAESQRALPVLLPSVAPVALPTAQEVALAPAVVVPVQLTPVATAALAALPTSQSLLPPKLVTKVEPELPQRLIRRLTRRVELRVDLGIDPEGRVREVQVAQGGNEELEQAVREAMLQWRYEPQGVARRHRVELVIEPS
jgi:TonB family protein